MLYKEVHSQVNLVPKISRYYFQNVSDPHLSQGKLSFKIQIDHDYISPIFMINIWLWNK